MKLSKTWIVVIIIVLVVVGYYVQKSVFKSPTQGLITEKVQRGDVLQEISETGSVKATEDISLGFKTIGKVSRLYVSVGDNVKKGGILAELDSSQLLAQLQAAKADLSSANTGAASAKDNLESAYNSALNTLNDAYTKIYNAYNAVVDLKNTYFGVADQEGIKVEDSKNDIKQNMSDVKSYLDQAKTNPDIDSAISETLTALDNVYNDLKIIRAQCDSGIYYYNIASTSKTSIDTQKTNINTASTNVTTAQSNISSYKIALQKAEDSTIKQAQADVDALQSQLNDHYLISPINGTVTSISIKRGQVVSASQTAVSLLSSEPFQIKANIYEQDIVKVKIGNEVKIELVPFPRQIFKGKVLSIDPAETIIDNVVYYQVTIDFPNQPEGIKSGMTADITIVTNKKENVLRVPKNAVQSIDGKDTVQVVKDGKIQNQQIITGLEGSDYYEVLSGLEEGDTIVVGKQ